MAEMAQPATMTFVPGVVTPTTYHWGKGYVVRNPVPEFELEQADRDALDALQEEG
jgi:hypothetical protein